MTCPLDLSGVSGQLDHVLASLAVLEPQNATVFADEHGSSTRLDFLSGE